MKVSPQTQTVYFLDIYQVEVSKDKSIYVNRCKKQVRGSDGRLERSPFVNAKKTSLVLPVKFGQYGWVRCWNIEAWPLSTMKLHSLPIFFFSHLRRPNGQLCWVPGLRRRLNRSKDHDMRSSFSGTKWTVHINNRGFHDREIFYCSLKSPPWREYSPKV